MSKGPKRSKAVSLVLVPTALLFGALPVLEGCKKQPAQDISDLSDSVTPASVPTTDTGNDTAAPAALGDMFKSVDECKAAKTDPNDSDSAPLYPPEECDRANAESLAQHVQNAPRFNTLAECEDQFGPSACGATSSILAGIPNQTIMVQQQSSGFMPFMAGYMLGSMGSGGRYHATSVYYPAGSWRSYSDTRALVPSGGYGYSAATSSKPIGYVVRSSTALSPAGGFGSRATVLPPTASGASPSNAAFRSAVSPRAAAVAPSSFGSSFGSTSRSSSFGSVTTPSARGGFGMSAGAHAGGFSGGSGFGG